MSRDNSEVLIILQIADTQKSKDFKTSLDPSLSIVWDRPVQVGSGSIILECQSIRYLKDCLSQVVVVVAAMEFCGILAFPSNIVFNTSFIYVIVPQYLSGVFHNKKVQMNPILLKFNFIYLKKSKLLL